MNDQKDLRDIQLDYAWKWFVYHADQRIKAFNFMIISLGVLTTALLTATGKVSPLLLGFLSLVACAIALLFSRLDRRNRDLVWRGEDVLMHLERTYVFPEPPKDVPQAAMLGRNQISFRGILIQEEGGADPNRAAEKGRLSGWAKPAYHRVETFLKNTQSPLFLGKHRVVIPAFAYVFALTYFVLAVVYIAFGAWFPVTK